MAGSPASRGFNAGRLIDGLRHLHRARLSLFHGQAGPRLIEATLATAQAYQQLRLYSAAKYYGLAAAALTQRDNLDLYPQGLFKAAAADYHQGNWVSSTQLNHAALVAHGLLAEQPFDFERHRWLGAALFELTNTKALADKLGAPYKELVDDAIADPGVSGLFNSFIEGLAQKGPPWWDGVDAEQHVAHAVEQLGRPPFADAGPHRRVRFQCLGVTWTVEFSNQEPDIAVGERFASTLQIALAHLAPADPALLPTSVKVFVTAGLPGTDLVIEQVEPTPTQTCFRCTLAAIERHSPEVYTAVAQQTLGAAATVIVTVSTLPDDRWKVLLDQAFEQDLPSSTTFAIPYDVAFHGATRNHRLRLTPHEQPPLASHDTACPTPALAWAFPTPLVPVTPCRTATTRCASSTRTSPGACARPWRPSGTHRPSRTRSQSCANVAGSIGISFWPSTASRRMPGCTSGPRIHRMTPKRHANSSWRQNPRVTLCPRGSSRRAPSNRHWM